MFFKPTSNWGGAPTSIIGIDSIYHININKSYTPLKNNDCFAFWIANLTHCWKISSLSSVDLTAGEGQHQGAWKKSLKFAKWFVTGFQPCIECISGKKMVHFFKVLHPSKLLWDTQSQYKHYPMCFLWIWKSPCRRSSAAQCWSCWLVTPRRLVSCADRIYRVVPRFVS